jgi:hypothetical protein
MPEASRSSYGQTLDARKRDTLARLLIGEEPTDDGQRGVASVVLNRASRGGMDPMDVVSQKGQFEPYANPKRWSKLLGLSPDDPAYKQAAGNLDYVLQNGPTTQADHFYAPKAQAALGRPMPSWDNGSGQDIGQSRFLNLGFKAPSGYQRPAQAAPDMGVDTAAAAPPQQPPPQQPVSAPPAPPPPPGAAGRAIVTPEEIATLQAWMQSGDPELQQAAQQKFQQLMWAMAQRPEYSTSTNDQGQAVFTPKTPGIGQPYVQDIPGYRGPNEVKFTDNGQVVRAPKSGGPATAENIPGFSRTVHAGDLQYNGQGSAQPIPGPETAVQGGAPLGLPQGSVVQRKPGGDASVLYTPPPGYASAGPPGPAPGPAAGGVAPPGPAAPGGPPGASPQPGGMAPIPGGPAAMQVIEQTRSEINRLPELQNYQMMVPQYQAIRQAGPTRAGDLNIVYAFAKLLDPSSVVREGEAVMVKSAAALPDWLVGQINRLNGGQALQPQTRAAIQHEAQGRMANARTMVDKRLQFYRDFAQRNGLNPADIVPNLPDFNSAGGGKPAQYTDAQWNAVQKYRGAKGQTPLVPTTKEQYDRIPKGTLIIDQDGWEGPKP